METWEETKAAESTRTEESEGDAEKKVWCYCCRVLGHIAKECLNQKEALVDDAGGEEEEEGQFNFNVREEDIDDYGDVGNSLFIIAMIIQKGARKTIETGWLLFDNHSTYDIFSNTWISKDTRNYSRSYM